jgi:general secretion pathway protein G
MAHRPPTPHRQGFTLIELLVVITIIAILAALILSTAGGIQKKAARDRAKAEISALSTALESYKADYGDYPIASNAPSATSSDNSIILYGALVGVNTNLNPNRKVYFEPSKSTSATTNYSTAGNYFVDPFSQPYQYRYPGSADKSGTNFFDLWSYAGSTKTAEDTNNHVFWEKNW